MRVKQIIVLNVFNLNKYQLYEIIVFLILNKNQVIVKIIVDASRGLISLVF